MVKSVRLIMLSAYPGHLPQPLWLAATMDERQLAQLLTRSAEVTRLSSPLPAYSCPVQWQPKSGFCADEAEVMCNASLFFFRSLNRMTGTRVRTRSLPVHYLARLFAEAEHQDTLFLSHDAATLKAIYYGTTRTLCPVQYAL